jgi:hypothetical protein
MTVVTPLIGRGSELPTVIPSGHGRGDSPGARALFNNHGRATARAPMPCSIIVAKPGAHALFNNNA